MSLIRVRRSRKKNWVDVRKGMSRGRLLVLLVVVLALIWYLGRI
ncbi:MAG: hypothetical protein PVJ02_05170 [Gemmatimonadota bacterium]|jgi:hypothetical protein